MFSVLKSQVDPQEHESGYLACIVTEILGGQINYTDIVSKCDMLDVLELFEVCDAIDEEHLNICLENFVLEDFLMQNDPKMLIGLTEENILADLKKVITIQETERIKFDSDVTKKNPTVARNQDAVSVASSNMSSMKRSLGQSSSAVGQSMNAVALEIKTKQYHLNYKTKVELTTKACIALKALIRSHEIAACREFKRIEALSEEAKYQLSEVDGTFENFNLKVVKFGCDPDTGFISSEKFVIFGQQFLHSGMTICSKMRLTINNFQQKITSMKLALTSKQDMSVVLTGADFQKLLIRKELESKLFTERLNTLDFIKEFEGKVRYTLNFKRRELIAAEKRLKALGKKVSDVKKKILRTKSEVELINTERDKAIENLERLTELNESTYAPKTVDYIGLKEKLSKLEKELKILRRQNYLLNIRLKNAVQKAKVSK